MDGNSNPELENLKNGPGAFGDMGGGLGGPGLGGSADRSMAPFGLPFMAGGQGICIKNIFYEQ